MGSMTDERRKEMEEEMMRFEQEIAFPGDESPPGAEAKVKPLPPPPGPPDLIKKDVTESAKRDKILKDVLPEVLAKPPPPPPSTDAHPPRAPLPPPPTSIGRLVAPGTHEPHKALQGPQMQQEQAQHSGPHIQFIPHQLQRQPPRMSMPPPRPTMLPVRNLPSAFPGPPGQLPFPMLPPMPHHMHLPPMGMHIPMGPGFCPPPPPGMQMGHMPMGHMPMPSQPFVPTSTIMSYQQRPPPSSKKEDTVTTKAPSTKSEPETVSAPAVYAAPPMKSLSEKIAETTSSGALNGQSTVPTTVSSSMPQAIDEPKSAKTAEESSTAATTPTPTTTEPALSKKEKKKKKIIRNAGGQLWEDNSLVDWDPDDFRIFCGDLGNDVTDEVLIRAFSKYQSFGKAKVIRDKRTNKTKGYGFVSFKDPQDFIKAMREMNGRYVGSRPIKLRKSTWRDRNIEVVRKKQKEKEKLGLL